MIPFVIDVFQNRLICFGAIIILLFSLVSCSDSPKNKTETSDTAHAVVPKKEIPLKTPEKTEEIVVDRGFDPVTLPVSSQTFGAFPYVSLIDGYEKMTLKTKKGDSSFDFAKDVEFDRYEFFDGVKIIPIEGKLITIKAIGKGASSYQVFKTYESLVTGLGGVKVWQGKGSVMVDNKIKFEDKRHRARYEIKEEEMGIYAVKNKDKEIWVEAYKTWNDGENYWLTIVEKKVLPVLAAVIPADQIKKELDLKGHVALYINFDTDKSTIKPESQPVITEVVKLLKSNPGLKLTIEGHTDNVGKPDYNMQLSESRAKSVVEALVNKSSIESRRLKSLGFGQTKSIADNNTDEGRAKNRRVELVSMK